MRLVSHKPVEEPQVLVVNPQPINLDDYKREFTVAGRKKRGFRNAQPEDVRNVLVGNWLVYDASLERVVIAYLQIPEDYHDLIPYLQRIKWTTSSRNDGTPSTAKTVGHLERNPIRQRDFCRLAGLATEDAEAHEAILSYAERAAKWYRGLNPELYAHHMGLAEKVLAQYRVGGGLFTSGIVNKDNVLPYHYDTGNFQNVWSLMLGFKRDVEEGWLVIPQYDLALEVADNTLSGFDGQVALHGVTPFRKLSRHAYRYTIVYYSKTGMWKCLSLDEEIARARKQRTDKELNRYARSQG